MKGAAVNEATGNQCEVVLSKAADGTITAEWKDRSPGSWVKVSCEAIDVMVDESNVAVEALAEVERLSVAAGILQKLVAHSAITRRPQFRAGLNADELAYLAAVAAGVETDREAQNDAR